jgi:hypothetical protein
MTMSPSAIANAMTYSYSLSFGRDPFLAPADGDDILPHFGLAGSRSFATAVRALKERPN